MRYFYFISICFLLVACSSTDDDILDLDVSLANYIKNRQIETGAVIACSASSEENPNSILTFFYPESGAVNFRLYKTENILVDKLAYSEYIEQDLSSTPFFNGYLRQYTTDEVEEKWIIVTYELGEGIKISNPIRTKQLSKPTVWNDAVMIDQSMVLMPDFSWQANALQDNAIYFQVVSKANDDLVSGTYTFENRFKFYDVSNVVLNITEGIPMLENNSNYKFTLMDVSLDNWVNLVSQKTFQSL